MEANIPHLDWFRAAKGRAIFTGGAISFATSDLYTEGGYLNNATDIKVVKNTNYVDATLGVRDVVITGVTMKGGGLINC